MTNVTNKSTEKSNNGCPSFAAVFLDNDVKEKVIQNLPKFGQRIFDVTSCGSECEDDTTSTKPITSTQKKH